MRTFLISVFASLVSIQVNADPPFTYQPYFAAVIVKDVNVSSPWYRSLFDLKLKEEMKDDATYRVHILESPGFLVELLELKGSLNPDDHLKDKPQNMKMLGHFKFGVKVASMDECLKHLANLHINVPQVWTDSKTGKRNFLIEDPDGNLIQFFE